MKFKVILMSSILSSVAVLSTGCGSGSATPKQSTITSINSASIVKSSITSVDAAETLALAGEKLAYTPGFMYADELFDMALKVDPKNTRARLYKAVLAPVLLQEGILARVAPLISKVSDHGKDEFKHQVNEIPESDYKRFLFNGVADISTEAEAQKYVRNVQGSMRTLMNTLKSMSSEQITLHVHDIPPSMSLADVLNKCQIDRLSLGNYKVTGCKFYKPRDAKMNFADFEAARLVVAVHDAYIGLSTIYTLDGAAELSRELEKLDTYTEQEAVLNIRSHAGLGKLADVSTLTDIMSMGLEGVEAVKFAAAHQKEWCSTKNETRTNRPGELFFNGFCVSQSLFNSFQRLEGAINGPVKMETSTYLPAAPYVREYDTLINISPILHGREADLQSYLPTQFNSCGMPVSNPNVTLNGLFPRGDAKTLFQTYFTDTNCPQK